MNGLPALVILVAMHAAGGKIITSKPLATEGGLIAAASADARGVRVFKGIPYASPPTGERRWRAPEPVQAWSGVRATDRFGASCAQVSMFPGVAEYDDHYSEDCLSLNVWTAARDASERLPVLVWIHGGAYVVGTGREAAIDGTELAAKGLVVVTFNYRLGVFGFLAHPDLTGEVPQRASGNYGMLDQIAALRWVQRNIGAFGGDPTRVAIGGNSAGATSVNILMASPLAAGLFSRAIAQGGSAMSISAPNDGSPLPRAFEERKGEDFAHSLGVQGIRELRALPTDALLEASGRQWSTWAWNASIDGYVLPAAPMDLFNRGLQNDVPLLVGWAANEGAAIGRATFGGDDESFAEQIAARFGMLAPEVLRLYPASTQQQERASKAAIAGEGFIACPSWQWAAAHSRTGKRPVFIYKFEYAPPVPPEFGHDSMIGVPGAFHGSEMAYVFGNVSRKKGWSITARDERISAGVQAYWTRFIAAGDPKGAGVELPQWPAYADNDPQRLHIGNDRFQVLRDIDRERFEQLSRLAAAAPGSLSYRGMNAQKWAQ
jgi:para-nitrobenzyl esterase